MQKKKIAFVIPSLPYGGAERVVTNLANELVSDYDVSVITMGKVVPFYTLHKEVNLLYCVERVLPSTNILKAIRSNYILLKRLSHLVKTHEIQVLIGFLTTANVLATLAGKYRGIPVIISERNNPFSQKPAKMWQIIRRFAYPKADYVVVQTATIRSFYEKKIKDERLKQLPNPISRELSGLRRGAEAPRENIVLNVGRLSPQKAQDVLINAFAKIPNSDWKLVIAGDGKKMKEYQELVASLNLADRVLFAGSVKDVHKLYNTAQIFAFTSIFEGFPNALIEAMHFGLACVSTDCPTGPSELIKDGENGFLIPMNDVDALANRLEDLMNDMEKRKVFGTRAKKVVSKFEMNEVASQWKILIESTIKPA